MGKRFFISHASEELHEATRLAGDLFKEKQDVWLDILDLKPGDKVQDSIVKGIEWCDIVILALSPNAVNSRWVQLEYSEAQKKGKRVIPVLFKGCDIPDFLVQLKTVDMRTSEEWSRAMSDILKAFTGEPGYEKQPVSLISRVEWMAAWRDAGLEKDEEIFKKYQRLASHLKNIRQLQEILSFFDSHCKSKEDTKKKFCNFFLRFSFDSFKRYRRWFRFAEESQLPFKMDKHEFALRMTPLEPNSLLAKYRKNCEKMSNDNIRAWIYALIQQAGGLEYEIY